MDAFGTALLAMVATFGIVLTLGTGYLMLAYMTHRLCRWLDR